MRCAHNAPAARAADESGFILVMAILILLVVTVLVGAVATAAIDVSNISTQVAARDRALAAADDGLQAALFRLNTTGASTSATDTLGNGATYTYTIAALTSSSASCAGLWVQSSGQTVQQACITSSGTVADYSVRVQDRVVGYTPASTVFPVNGMFAVNGFTANQNFTDNGAIRSNGQISWGGGTTQVTGDVEYLSQYPVSGCSGTCTPVLESSPLPVPTSAATTDAAYANAATTNSDSSIVWDPKITYDATTQTVTDNTGGNNTITLEPGTYYFCNLSFNNATTLQADASAVSASKPVIIYIDSPYRSGSSCASGTGNIADQNTLNVTGVAGAAGAFQIYVYGEPQCPTSPAVPCPTNFSMNNQTYTNVQIYAPYSSISTSNNITMTGDFVIGNVTVKNNAGFTYSGSGSGGSTGNGSALTNYYPSAHQICLPSTTTSGTTGGC